MTRWLQSGQLVGVFLWLVPVLTLSVAWAGHAQPPAAVSDDLVGPSRLGDDGLEEL